MRIILTLLLFSLSLVNVQAQLLKKLKQKIDQAAVQAADKVTDSKPASKPEKKAEQPAVKSGSNDKATDASVSNEKAGNDKQDLKVTSKFDFVPGNTILYFDNFEKDNIGEAPLGWITSTSAEVVTIEGLEGKWLKMSSVSTQQITRNKKQSWGNNFTAEFDLLIVRKDYDPRIDINLINTDGNLVTDEAILGSEKKPAINFSTIIAEGSKSRASLYAFDNRLSDNMTENLPYNNTSPVHVSMCVQGKRFRLWWNNRKLYDLPAANEEYLPNQLGFSFGSVGGSEFYVSNIRVAKDIPDTRAKFEEGKLVSNLLFYSGTAKLKPESMGSLLDVSKILKDATSTVKIVGHTDSDGDDALNLKLSRERAETVKEILVSQYGIDASKLTTDGRGETQPIADNKTAEGKAQNRRVEFIFKPEADKYTNVVGAGSNNQTTNNNSKPVANSGTQQVALSSGATSVTLQSKILNVSLPYAQFLKRSESSYTFIASKEEGNGKENYFKIELQTVNTRFKPETYNFKEINEKNPLYGTKKFSEITKTEAMLTYGTTTKPYIYKFSSIIANGHMATYVSEDLSRHLPASSSNCKLVIEKVEDGKVSGYFLFGIMIQGLKPIKKGDAMQETFTDGFSGEMKCTFSNVPVY